MDCEVHWIGCQLAEIATKVGQSTSWDKAGVVVSAIAAIGTLAIAYLNLRLLRRERAERESAQTDLKQGQRVAWVAKVLEEAIRIQTLDLAEQTMSSLEFKKLELEVTQATFKLQMHAQEYDFPNGVSVLTWVTDRAQSKATESQLVSAVLQLWILTPEASLRSLIDKASEIVEELEKASPSND